MFRRALSIPFLRFCLVGGVGFLVDAGFLELFVAIGLPPYAARVISMILALQTTYVLHGRFTFKSTTTVALRDGRAWLAFNAANGFGALMNYLVFLLMLSVLPFGNALLQRQSSLVIGMATALVFNYWANRRLVFKVK